MVNKSKKLPTKATQKATNQNPVIPITHFDETGCMASMKVPNPLNFHLHPIKDFTLCGGEEINSGTLHGGENIEPGTLHGGEAIEPGTLHSSTTYSPASYKTKDGRAIYKFRYVNIGGKFEIDIISQPSYNGRDESSSVSHRLTSDRGGKKICISTGHEPTTLKSAQDLSMEWAELTHVYAKSGKTIDTQVASNAKKSGGFWSRLFK